MSWRKYCDFAVMALRWRCETHLNADWSSNNKISYTTDPSVLESINDKALKLQYNQETGDKEKKKRRYMSLTLKNIAQKI